MCGLVLTPWSRTACTSRLAWQELTPGPIRDAARAAGNGSLHRSKSLLLAMCTPPGGRFTSPAPTRRVRKGA